MRGLICFQRCLGRCAPLPIALLVFALVPYQALAQSAADLAGQADQTEEDGGSSEAANLGRQAEQAEKDGGYSDAIRLMERAYEIDHEPYRQFDLGILHEENCQESEAVACFLHFRELVDCDRAPKESDLARNCEDASSRIVHANASAPCSRAPAAAPKQAPPPPTRDGEGMSSTAPSQHRGVQDHDGDREAPSTAPSTDRPMPKPLRYDVSAGGLVPDNGRNPSSRRGPGRPALPPDFVRRPALVDGLGETGPLLRSLVAGTEDSERALCRYKPRPLLRSLVAGTEGSPEPAAIAPSTVTPTPEATETSPRAQGDGPKVGLSQAPAPAAAQPATAMELGRPKSTRPAPAQGDAGGWWVVTAGAAAAVVGGGLLYLAFQSDSSTNGVYQRSWAADRNANTVGYVGQGLLGVGALVAAVAWLTLAISTPQPEVSPR